MIFVLPYPPSANAYWRTVKNRTYVTNEARRYKRDALLAAKAQRNGATLVPTCTVSVTVSVYRPQKRGDLDNTIKVLLDSLKGVAFVDDAQVVELHATRHDDASNPRVVVTVEAA